MADLPNGFTAFDFVVFLASVVISMAIGVYFAFKEGGQKTQGDYLMGGRKLKMVPVSISILASIVSAILILGTPAEMYMQGTEYYIGGFGKMLGFLLAGLLFVPLLYPLRLTSAYEYLELRFRSRSVRLLGTYIMVFGQIIYVALASYAPATALEAVTGFPVAATLVIAGSVTTFYTTIGGMKAVIWTDVFQGFLMVAGVLSIIIQGTIKVGGFGKVWRINEKWERIRFFTVDIDPRVRHSIFTLLFGQGLGYLASAGVSQSAVQRYSSLRTLREAQNSMFLNVAVLGTLYTMVCYAGITMFAYYAEWNCDLLAQDMVDNSNQLIPYFVMDILAFPGVPGLFMASLFSGALSSMSSSLNAMAAILWEDTLKPHLDHRLSEVKKTLLLKCLVALIGMVCIAVSYGMIFVDGTVVQAAQALIGPSGGTLSGLFVLGALFPCSNKYGALAGGITGTVLASWQAVGSYVSGISNYYLDLPTPNGTCIWNWNETSVSTTPLYPNITTTMIPTTQEPGADGNTFLTYFYSISYLYVSFIATQTVIVVGLIVSFITNPLIPREEREVPTKYLLPLFTRLCCCLPKSWLYYMDCCRHFETPEQVGRSIRKNTSRENLLGDTEKGDKGK